MDNDKNIIMFGVCCADKRCRLYTTVFRASFRHTEILFYTRYNNNNAETWRAKNNNARAMSRTPLISATSVYNRVYRVAHQRGNRGHRFVPQNYSDALANVICSNSYTRFGTLSRITIDFRWKIIKYLSPLSFFFFRKFYVYI